MATKIQIFSNWGARGWSDVWYTSAAVTDPLLPAKILAVATARAALYVGDAGPSTDGNPAPIFYRISDTNNPNTGQPFGFNANMDWDRSGLVTPDRRNWPYATLRLASGGRHRILLKGAPQSWIAGNINVRYAPFIGALKTNFLAYLAACNAAGFQGLANITSNPQPVTSVTVDANNRIQLTVADATGFTAQQKVKLKGMRGPGSKKVNGVTKVRSTATGGIVVLNKKKCDPCPLDPDTLGTLYVVTPTLSAVSWPDPTTGLPPPITGFTSGKLGRVFSPELGKARNCCR